MLKSRKERSRRYYLKHKEEIRKKQKLYYLKNKDKFREKGKKWHDNNIEKCRESVKKWTTKNKKKIKKYLDLHFKENLNAKLSRSLRTRLYSLIKCSPDSAQLQSLIGCTFSEFISYISSKFKTGMSWENHSKYGWHLDHIKPCSAFDLTQKEEIKKCFHYTNFQPLWAKDNLSKTNKLDYVIQG